MATPNHHENKPSSALQLVPPPFPSHCTTRKRLLDGSPPNSTSLESSSLDQLPKRITRDLPNLSDCHGCQTRVNHTNPKDRLQTLDSYWRVVLLCKKCIKLVNSAQICAYCFKETVNSDCFTCGRCKRCIHKDCVSRYGHSSPWSYSRKERGSLCDFSVCIDCWVPKLLKNSKVCRSIEKAVSKPRVTGDYSKVSLNDYDADVLENSKNDANAKAKKKILVSAKEKEKTLGKVLAVKNVMDLTKNAPEQGANNEMNGYLNGGLIVNNSISSSSSSSTNPARVTKNVNDAELPFQLHHAINSSPRIPKDLHLTNTNNFSVPKDREKKIVVSKLVELGNTPWYGEGEKIVVYRRTRLREKFSTSISEASVCAREKVIGSSIDLSRTDAKLKTISGTPAYGKDRGVASYIDLSRTEHKVITYKKTRFKRKDRDDFFVSVIERCNLDGDSRVASESQSCQRDDLTQESHLYEFRIPFPVKCDGDATLQTERCNEKEVRYLLKYSRRCVISKPGLDHQTSMHGDGTASELHLCEAMIPSIVNCDGKVTLQDKSCCEKEDRYSFKYSKRRRGPIPEFQTRAALCQVMIPCLVKSEGEVNLPNENHNMEGRYLIKYSKRCKGSKLVLDHESSMHDDPKCDPGLPRNRFAESRTSSDASVMSSLASVQACASVNVSTPKDF